MHYAYDTVALARVAGKALIERGVAKDFEAINERVQERIHDCAEAA